MPMFSNKVNCDIYIGTGAGKKLLSDIENARSSIKIISPFLSPSTVGKLIDLHNRGIKIELITTDTIEDYQRSDKKNLYKLIIQNREVDNVAVEKRKRFKKTGNFLLAILFVIILGLIYFIYNFKDLRLLYVLLPVFLLFLAYRSFRRKFKYYRTYSYWYSQLFPFKVFVSPQENRNNGVYVHSKIFIIDDKIAYLGSLNFTASGTKNNYETRIRTIDSSAVAEIMLEFEGLYNSDFAVRDIGNWGKNLYREPLN